MSAEPTSTPSLIDEDARSYGVDDETGALNLITPERVLSAIGSVRQGRIYDLDAGRFMGMPLWSGHPQLTVLGYRSPYGLAVTGEMAQFHPGPNSARQSFNSDMVISSTHTGCHIDALSHITIGDDAHWYNGYRAADSLSDHGPMRADAAALSPIVARGVLADVAAYRSVDRLPAHDGVGVEELQAVLRNQGTMPRRGDVLLLRTGLMRDWPNAARMAEGDGSGLRLDAAHWLADTVGVAAVGADNSDVEALPSDDPNAPQPVHVFLLIKRGVPLIEFAYLEELARDRVYEFLFVALPLKISGTTGSMIRPIAVV